MANRETLCATLSTNPVLADRDSGYRHFITKELARGVTDALVGKLSNGEKIVRLCDVKERQSVNICMVEFYQSVFIEDIVRCGDCAYFESGIRCSLRNEQTGYKEYCSKGRRTDAN